MSFDLISILRFRGRFIRHFGFFAFLSALILSGAVACLPTEVPVVSKEDSSKGVYPGFTGIVSAQTVAANKVKVTWNPSTDSRVVAYIVYDTRFKFDPKPLKVVDAPASETTVSGLDTATLYSLRVRAANAKGVEDSNMSDLRAIPYAGVLPAQVQSSSAALIPFTNGSTADQINVYCKTQTTEYELKAEIKDVSKREVLLENLLPGTTYTCRAALVFDDVIDNNVVTTTFKPMGTASALVFTTQPGSATAGQNLAPQPTINILDSNGNIVSAGPDSTAVITLTVSSASPTVGNVRGTATAAAVAGVAVFKDLFFQESGAKILTATKEDTSSQANGSAPISIDSNPFTISPAAVSATMTKIAISPAVPPNSPLIANGIDAYTVTISLKDQFGNPISGIRPTFSSNIVGDTLSQPAQNSSALGEASGSFSSTVADTNPARILKITSPAGLTDVTVTAPMVAGAAAKLAFMQQPVNSPAGDFGLSEVKVAVTDTQGNVVSTGAAATSNISLTIASNVNGATLSGTTTVQTINGVATFADLGIDKTATGYKLAASSGSYTPAFSNAFNVTSGTPRKIQITGPSAVISGACSSAYTFRLIDDGNNSANAIQNTPVTLNGLGSGSFYTSSSCGGTSAGTTVTFTAGTSTKTLYFKNNKAEVLNLVARDTSSVLTDGTFTLNSRPSKVSLSALMPSPPAPANTPMSIVAGQCSPGIVITPAGFDGNVGPISVESLVAITGVSGSSAKLFSDSSCLMEIDAGNVVLPVSAGTNYTTKVYLKDQKAESLNLSVVDYMAVLTTTSGLQPVTIGASRINFTGPSSAVSGQCSTAFTVTLRDELGNAVVTPTNASLTINGLSGSANGMFYTSPSCSGGGSNSTITVPATYSSTTVYFRDIAAQTLDIYLSDPAGKMASSETVSVTISPSALSITTPASSSKTTVCTGPFVVNTLDGNGNSTPAVGPINVTLSGAGTGGAYYTDSTCSATTTGFTYSAGQSTKQYYFKGQFPNAAVSMTATDNAGVLTPGSATFVVTAAPGWLGTDSSGFDSNGNLYWFTQGIVPVSARSDGPASAAALAFSPDKQYLYVLDSTRRRVLKYDYALRQYIGWTGQFWNAGGLGIAGSNLSTPSTASCVATLSGTATPGWCVGGQSTSTGNNTLGGMNWPQGMAVDANYVYVADYSGDAVLRYDANTGARAGYIGRVSTTPTSAGPGGPASCTSALANQPTPGWCMGGANSYNFTHPYTGNGIIRNPRGIVVHGSYLYVGITGAILRFDLSSGTFQGWIGVAGAVAPTGGAPGCTALANGQLTPGWCTGGTFQAVTPRTVPSPNGGGVNTPTGMTVVGNVLYVVHTDSGGTITTYDADTGAYLGRPANLAYNWSSPRNITSDGSTLFVADWTRLIKVDKTDGLLLGWMGKVSNNTSMSGPGCSTLVPNANTPGWCLGGTAKAGNDERSFHDLMAIAYDGNGNIVTGQGNTFPGIKIFDIATGAYGGMLANRSVSPTQWSNDTTRYADYEGYDDNSMFSPAGVYNDSTHLYLVERNAARIKKIELATGRLVGWIGGITTPPTGGAAGCVGANAMGPAPGWCLGALFNPNYLWNQMISSTTNGILNQPMDITGDGTHLYVVDYGWHRILKFNQSTGAFVGWIGGVGTTPPTGGAAGCNGAVQGTFTPGWCQGGSSQNGNGDGHMNLPSAIMHHAGTLYVVDAANQRVSAYNASNGSFVGWIGRTDVAPTSGCSPASNGAYNVSKTGWCKGGTAQGAVSGDRGGGFSFWSGRRAGITTDGSNLYIANFNNYRIDKFSFAGVFLGAVRVRPDQYTHTWTTDPDAMASWAGQNCAYPVGIWTDGTHMYGQSYGVCSDGNAGATWKMNLSTGLIVGWMGAITPGQSPNDGDPGCAGAVLVTPGWCRGGRALPGYTLGGFTNAAYHITGGTHYIYVTDESTNRVTRLPK